MIINLCDRELSEDEINVLKKGAKFTPIPKRNNNELKRDVNDFCRKLRLKEYFADKNINDDSIVKGKSNFQPERNRNQTLEKYIDFLKTFSDNYESDNNGYQRKNNLSKNESDALQKLIEDDDVIIKQADKGGAFVLMKRDFYISKMNDHLDKTETYHKLSQNEDNGTMNKIKGLVKKHENIFTKKEKAYIINFEYKTSYFYGLPKIHQSKRIKENILEQNSSYVQCGTDVDLKMRPIVAGPVCPTHRLSNLIDVVLKPYLKHVKSYIRDSVDFLNHLPENIDEDSLLVTFDVNSLYTNIDHQVGLDAIRYWLETYPEDLNPRINKEFVLEAIELILKNNILEFNGNFYKQIKGTAMGTKMAPTYANMFLGYLEKQLYKKVEENISHKARLYVEENWFRYLDDCFIIWKKEFGDVKNFYDILQNIHEDIKFKIDISVENISFLDINVTKKNCKLETDIYYKITDTHQYLHFNSCHPRHTKRNVPYNLARRICTIVSNEEIREKRLKELESMLILRKYPKGLIEVGIQKARCIEQKILRQTKKKIDQLDNIAFVSTYNPNNGDFSNSIKRSMPLLSNDANLKRIFDKTNYVASRRQAPNLKKILTKASLEKAQGGTKKCKDKRCKTCPYMPTTDKLEFKSNDKQKTFQLKDSFSCTSRNLIYCMTCNGCGKKYIGETGGILRNRMTLHRQHIREKKYQILNVSKHISICAKGISPEFHVVPFYKLKTDNENQRKIKEKHFIDIFQPELNRP